MAYPKFIMTTEEKKLEKEKKKFNKELSRLMDLYSVPSKIKSRAVRSVDINRVIKDGKDMAMMCQLPRGNYGPPMALAHTQIKTKDPLRFFVTIDGLIVINPLIINHTKAHLFDTEGCMSFPDEKPKTMVPRYYKVTVEYQTIAEDGKTGKKILTPWQTIELKGMPSRIFQHEISHLNGCSIHDDDFDPAKAVGIGDGLLINHEIWNNKK